MRQATIYTAPGCEACGIIKDMLRDGGCAITEVDADNMPDDMRAFVTQHGGALPGIMIDGEMVSPREVFSMAFDK